MLRNVTTSIVTICALLFSCSSDVMSPLPKAQPSQDSQTQQAAAACLILAPVPPAGVACAVTVTAAQVVVAIVAGGAVVGTVYLAKRRGPQNAWVAGYNVQVGSTMTSSGPKCNPCPPPRGPRFDQVPPSRKHGSCKGSHWQYYRMNQTPDCRCFERDDGPVVCA